MLENEDRLTLMKSIKADECIYCSTTKHPVKVSRVSFICHKCGKTNPMDRIKSENMEMLNDPKKYVHEDIGFYSVYEKVGLYPNVVRAIDDTKRRPFTPTEIELLKQI